MNQTDNVESDKNEEKKIDAEKNKVKKIEVEKTEEKIRKNIDDAMERENYKEVDQLSKKLCNMQGFEEESAMPENFLLQILQRDRMDRKHKWKKNLIKAAVACIIVVLSGGTVYAGVSHFRNVKQVENGFEIGNGDNDTDPWWKDNPNTVEPPTPEIAKDEIIERVEGTEKDAWISREKVVVTAPGYATDDGVTWKPLKPDVFTKMVYKYKDYGEACEDQDFIDVFDRIYEQKEHAQYTICDFKNDGTSLGKSLRSFFWYGDGSFEISQRKDEEESNGAFLDNHKVKITTVSEVTNQRKYTSKNSIEFQLLDELEDEGVRTVTIVSKGKYTIILIFRELTEEQIHEVLDTVQF